MYTVVDNALTPLELAHIHDLVDNPDRPLPWYYTADDVHQGSGSPFLSHAVLQKDHLDRCVRGTPNSDLLTVIEPIFDRLCPERDLFLRCSINRTFGQAQPVGTPHVDHEFDHTNCIVYVSEASGGTVLFDDTGETAAVIPAQYNRAVKFAGTLHAPESCRPGETRTVLVFTYTTLHT